MWCLFIGYEEMCGAFTSVIIIIIIIIIILFKHLISLHSKFRGVYK